MITLQRGCGILLHITSLPSRYGIGDLGQGAYDFIDFLAAAGQKYWQILPIGPVSSIFHNSPYMSLAAFAGNPLFVSPEKLVEDGYLSQDDLAGHPDFSQFLVEFDNVVPFKIRLLEKAFQKFIDTNSSGAFETFCQTTNWLDDYAIFMAIKEDQDQRPWNLWPRDLASRDQQAINGCRQRLSERILYHKFVQFCFFQQWQRLHQYATDKGISLIGDIPIYVAFDSVDVWAHQECYKLHSKTLAPKYVAGVPPDYFSETGQRWGNPIYRWTIDKLKVNEPLYLWWQERFKNIFQLVDVIRIDHFRGFETYWEIPAEEEYAIKGRWVKGPGRSFFMHMARKIGALPIIAEDLGELTPEVEKMREDTGFPGMKILHFAFDSDEKNLYLPHNFETTNCVVYTGTHDNDTTLGWHFDPDVPETSKEKARRYAKSDGSLIHWDFIEMAFASIAGVAIIPLQDILGFGNDCRMNKPSTTTGNWLWRCAPQFLTEEVQTRLLNETIFYNRYNNRST